MRWEVGAAEMGSLRRMMERVSSCRARRPWITFWTCRESAILIFGRLQGLRSEMSLHFWHLFTIAPDKV